MGLEFRQARSQCQQMAGKVAAVHAGNVERQQGFEGSGIIPIEEVAVVSIEAPHGIEGVLRAPQELANRQVAKVARGQIGQQRQPHVRGRGP